MDFIVGLPTTARGHDLVWVVVDRLTKLCRFIPTKSTVKTFELARLFVQQLYRLYGLPSNIVSDRDQKFNSHFWRSVFKRLGTQLNLSTADHPEIDGQIERVNQVLEDMLRAYVVQKSVSDNGQDDTTENQLWKLVKILKVYLAMLEIVHARSQTRLMLLLARFAKMGNVFALALSFTEQFLSTLHVKVMVVLAGI
ncbi:hypothetical protein L7F22_022601 [Adiantum nelumboides]|nr:hypothetical protein [Adiantum nelumboides]